MGSVGIHIVIMEPIVISKDYERQIFQSQIFLNPWSNLPSRPGLPGVLALHLSQIRLCQRL